MLRKVVHIAIETHANRKLVIRFLLRLPERSVALEVVAACWVTGKRSAFMKNCRVT